MARSTRGCLLSLIFQLALNVSSYRNQLVPSLEKQPELAESNPQTLWQKLILGLLSRSSLEAPLIWIFDALDESEDPQLLLSLLKSLSQKRLLVRVILLARPQSISRPMERFKHAIDVRSFDHVSLTAPEQSIRSYISQELQFTPWNADLKNHITTSLVDKVNGNFLWTYLVMRKLLECDTADDVEDALSQTPYALSEVYTRMERAISAGLRPHNHRLARTLFFWITCSERPLYLDEIQVFDLQHNIGKLCGDFVTVDKNLRVSVVHHTAKEFILQPGFDLSVDKEQAHQVLLLKCLGTLLDQKFKYRLRSHGCVGFMRYACMSWPYHLLESGDLDQKTFQKVVSFLKSRSILVWIHAISLIRQLKVLSGTAKALSIFVKTQRERTSKQGHSSQLLEDFELCTQWATELIRLLGRFGTHLLLYPQVVLMFCPPDSVASRLFAPKDESAPTITGLSNPGWDDCVARFSVGHDSQPVKITCLEGYFSILLDRTVNLYHSSTFQESYTFCHNEPIYSLAFSKDGEQLVTCGLQSVKVWDTSTG